VIKDRNILDAEMRMTSNKHEHNLMVRTHLGEILEGTSNRYKFPWNYWITFTFGRKPDVGDTEDILHKIHHRLDNRLLKHLHGKSVLKAEERSEWILVPEVSKKIGLHYHGFINLKVHPNLANGYENEWSWMRTALENTIKRINKDYPYLDCGFHIVERAHPKVVDAAVVFYTLKDLAKCSYKNLGLPFDPFAHMIISDLDWKPTSLHRHRSATKLSNIPPRNNKEDEGLMRFMIN